MDNETRRLLEEIGHRIHILELKIQLRGLKAIEARIKRLEPGRNPEREFI